jgi:hypothetical protein
VFVEGRGGCFSHGRCANRSREWPAFRDRQRRGISIRDAFELIAARVELITGRRVPVTTTDPGTRLSAIEQRHFVADSSRFSGRHRMAAVVEP